MFGDVAGSRLASTNLGLRFITANPTMAAVANWNATKAKLDGYTAREGHTALALSNGTILIFGGADPVRHASGSCTAKVMEGGREASAFPPAELDVASPRARRRDGLGLAMRESRRQRLAGAPAVGWGLLR